MSNEGQNTLQRQQIAARRVHDKLLENLMEFTPTQDLRVSDVKFIADLARTIAFDAIREMEP